MPQRKAVQVMKINEAGSYPPKRGREEFPLGDQGKSKKHIVRKGVVVKANVEWFGTEDDKPRIRQNRIRDRTLPISTRVSSVKAPPIKNLVLTHAPPVTLTPSITLNLDCLTD